MTFTLRPIDPVADLDLIHRWVTEPRAEFWGMTDKSRDEVGEIYQWLADADTHHAYLVEDGDRPVAIFQTYDPFDDPIGEAFEPQVGDLGVHLFIGPTNLPESGFTRRLIAFLFGQVFADPAVLRLVGEPDQRNTASVRRAQEHASDHAGRIDLGHKTAELFFLDRATWSGLVASA